MLKKIHIRNIVESGFKRRKMLSGPENGWEKGVSQLYCSGRKIGLPERSVTFLE